MLSRVKATHAKPAYQWTSCNICKAACPNPVLTAKAAVGQFDLCAGCAGKLGYDVGELYRKRDEAKELEQRNREAKELAMKQNAYTHDPFSR